MGAAVLLAGCATVKMSRVEPDWAANDQARVKRLAVVTAQAPGVPDPVQALWSLLARRYVNQKRDFLAKVNATAATPQAQCAGVEGVLWLVPDVKRAGNGVEASVDARLLRCSDGGTIWQAQAAGSWASRDDVLKETTAQYVTELGAAVEPFVAPSFRLLKAALDTLPNPKLNDEDVNEKIELGE